MEETQAETGSHGIDMRVLTTQLVTSLLLLSMWVLTYVRIDGYTNSILLGKFIVNQMYEIGSGVDERSTSTRSSGGVIGGQARHSSSFSLYYLLV